jgi:ATP-binding cassette subfamily A (ABC1) protein 3
LFLHAILFHFFIIFIPLGAQLKDYHQGLVHYHLPESGQSWARIFGLMESAKNKYQIEDYSVGQTTLEQVIFITIICALNFELFN